MKQKIEENLHVRRYQCQMYLGKRISSVVMYCIQRNLFWPFLVLPIEELSFKSTQITL